MPGLTAGTAGSGLLGGEISCVYLKMSNNPVFGGISADYVYDWKRKASRCTAGPEIGCWIFGLDGGVVISFEKGRRDMGYCFRPFIALPYLPVAGSIYYRLSVLKEASGSETVHEFGIIVKFPLSLH